MIWWIYKSLLYYSLTNHYDIIHLQIIMIWYIYKLLLYESFSNYSDMIYLQNIMILFIYNHYLTMIFLSRQCLGHLWSLSIDWQLSLMGILVFLPLCCENLSFGKKYTPLLALTCLSMIIPGLVSLSYSLPPLPSMSTLQRSLWVSIII